MNFGRLLLFVFASFLTVSMIGQERATTQSGQEVLLHEDGTWSFVMKHFEPGARLELPELNPSDTLIEHTGFSLVYNEDHEQAAWVAYLLNAGMTKSVVSRSNNFKPDPKVATRTADHADYKGSGFDRGHLAPAGDMGWSQASMEDSFYYSNMSPQRPGHNRGVWKRLEDLMRTWAVTYDSIYIATGPVLKEGLPVMGPNEVSIPEAYYKAVFRYAGDESEAIGFIVPNESSKAHLSSFALSVDSLEQVTGLNFFEAFEDLFEEEFEGRLCLPCWVFD